MTDCLREGVLIDRSLGVAFGSNCWLTERPWNGALPVVRTFELPEVSLVGVGIAKIS